MSDKLTVQIQRMERQYEDLKRYFASDGRVTPDEQRVLKDVETKLQALRKRTAGANGETAGAPGKATATKAKALPTGGHLTAAGWKAVLEIHSGKVRDNGLLRALAAYEKLKEDRLDDRLKALQLAFKLALDLGSKGAGGVQEVQEYLSKVCELAVKKQETLDAQRKAAAVPDAEKIMLGNMVVDAANGVSQSAKTNVALFGVEVLKACKAFEVHAKAELDELEGETTARELLGSLVGIVIPGIGEKLAEKVVDEIGKKIVNELAGALGDKLSGVVKGAADDGGKKALEKAVGSMVLAAGDAQGALLAVVTRSLIPLCDKVVADVNAGKQLSPQLTAFIEPFIREQSGKLDAMLEARFGVPSPAKAKQVQIKLFKDMVRVFEEKVIIATTPSGEKMEWNVTGIPQHVRRNADAKAQQAAKLREREMDQTAATTP